MGVIVWILSQPFCPWIAVDHVDDCPHVLSAHPNEHWNQPQALAPSIHSLNMVPSEDDSSFMLALHSSRSVGSLESVSIARSKEKTNTARGVYLAVTVQSYPEPSPCLGIASFLWLSGTVLKLFFL